MKITKRNGAWVGCRPNLQPSGESRIGYEKILDTSSTTPTQNLIGQAFSLSDEELNPWNDLCSKPGRESGRLNDKIIQGLSQEQTERTEIIKKQVTVGYFDLQRVLLALEQAIRQKLKYMLRGLSAERFTLYFS